MHTAPCARTDSRFNGESLCRCWHGIWGQAYSQQKTLTSLRAVSSPVPCGSSTFVWSPQMAPEVQLLLHGPKRPHGSPEPSSFVPSEQANLTLLAAVLSRRCRFFSTRSEKETSLLLGQNWALVQFPHLPEKKTTHQDVFSLGCAAINTTTCLECR